MSVSEEITRRLEMMFSVEGFAAQLFGGINNLRFVMQIMGAIRRAEERMGQDWDANQHATIVTKAAVMQEMTDHIRIRQIGVER